MKILLVVPEYPPFNIGGGGEVFRQIAENLRDFGHQVIVVYGYHPTKNIFEKIKSYDENKIKFIQVPEIPCPKFLPFLRTVLPMNLFVKSELTRIIKEVNPDVVNLHGYGQFFPAQVSKILIKLNIPYVLTLHGAPVSPGKMKGIIKIVYDFYNSRYGSPLLCQAKAITAVSKFSTTFSEFREFKTHILIINNGINIQELIEISRAEKTSIFDKYFKKESNLIFFSLGRLEWLKGFQHFINIIPELKKQGYSIKYCIGGADNNYKSELINLIKKLNLEKDDIFLGQLDINQKCNAYKFCDFVVVPSEVENFPAVPLEAMSLGKIPIVNDAGGIGEIVKDKYNGVICDVTDTKVFTNRVLEIIRDNKLKKNIENNFGDVKKYDWKNIVREYEKILQKNKKF